MPNPDPHEFFHLLRHMQRAREFRALCERKHADGMTAEEAAKDSEILESAHKCGLIGIGMLFLTVAQFASAIVAFWDLWDKFHEQKG